MSVVVSMRVGAAIGLKAAAGATAWATVTRCTIRTGRRENQWLKSVTADRTRVRKVPTTFEQSYLQRGATELTPNCMVEDQLARCSGPGPSVGIQTTPQASARLPPSIVSSKGITRVRPHLQVRWHPPTDSACHRRSAATQPAPPAIATRSGCTFSIPSRD